MRRSDIVLQRRVIIICLTVFCFSLSGCEPLRKKFTRKKKEETKRMADPVLEPVDYAPLQMQPLERYKYHYSMWRIWDKDLLTSLNTNEGDKRVSYLFTEMCDQLKEMDKWITGEKKAKLHSALGAYEDIRPQIEQPQAIRDVRSVMRKLERNAKDIRNNLAPDLVGDAVVPAQ